MQDSAVKEELQFSGKVKGGLIEPQKLGEQKIASEADLTSKNKEPNMVQKTKPSSTVKPTSSSKKTRKRGGRRKTGSSKQRRKATC